MAGVDDVAAAILEQTGRITTMKLQKLVYYCQVWHLVRKRVPLFEEPIRAYREGPVVEDLYRKHCGLYRIESRRHGKAADLDFDEAETVDWVVQTYGSFSAESLSRMTHLELPWRAARVGLSDGDRGEDEISVALMRDYYARQLSDPEQAVSHAAANSSLEGFGLDADFQDVLRAVADESESADEAVRREIERARQSICQ
ncbi:Panacea domain-containing protein [Amycolatopsis magusensis]|uniref:Panacea domain-containing protein n=1 Tax=Amycolatopsis magusensis TaxID=882444 RepID=UPI0037AA8E2C